MPAVCNMKTLLELCTAAIASALLANPEAVDVSRIPEAELALAIWHKCNVSITFGVQREELLKSFSSFWQPDRLAFLPLSTPFGLRLQNLRLVGNTLRHLELRNAAITNLDWLSGVPNLQCLLLPRCTLLPATALSSLCQVPQLQALNLSGCSLLYDTVATHLAALQLLEVLDVAGTSIGDATIQALAHRPASRGEKDGQQVKLKWLQASGSAVTWGCLEDLKLLPMLTFLDLRRTQVSRRQLLPLQHLRGLQPAQGACLVASAAVLAAAARQQFVCCCDTMEDASVLGTWARSAIQELIGADAAAEWHREQVLGRKEHCAHRSWSTRSQATSTSRFSPLGAAPPARFSSTQGQHAMACGDLFQQWNSTSSNELRSTSQSALGPSHLHLNRAQQSGAKPADVHPNHRSKRQQTVPEPQQPGMVSAAFAPKGVEHRKRKKREEDIASGDIEEGKIIEEGNMIRRGQPPASRKNLGTSFVDWHQWVARGGMSSKH